MQICSRILTNLIKKAPYCIANAYLQAITVTWCRSIASSFLRARALGSDLSGSEHFPQILNFQRAIFDS